MSLGLAILDKVKRGFGIPVTTDVHEIYQIPHVAPIAAVIQIPAFLSRQTDLLVAASKTTSIVNIKKAQFMSANDVQHSFAKADNGRMGFISNKEVGSTWITERGTCFGYNNLIVDFAGLAHLCDKYKTIIFDGTHCHQKPMGEGAQSGGSVKYVKHLCKAAIVVGVHGLFLETHPDPNSALSDGATSVKLDHMEALLTELRDMKEEHEGICNRYSSTAGQ